jgi:NitT/TauT family transport system substrate-binding protein
MADLQLSPLFGTNALVALQGGALQAGDLFAPSSVQATQSGVAKLVVPMGSGGGAMVMGQTRTSNPALARAIIRAILRTQRTYLQGDYHQDAQVVAAIASWLGVTPVVVTSPQNPALVFDPTGAYPASYLVPAQQYYLSVTPRILTYTKPMKVTQLLDIKTRTAVLAGK